ncbi:predicted ATPase of the AAA superfamily [Clostridium sp. SY8519]|uniref:ATP-binding protein n=1 Tax=Clostridium sp. (strain SY8519) TaxID=1042156 RepID=UPI00021722BA|nr:ATP--cob(I)alamin adenosyltransferase [Clostridium sp. SY8519]BAK48488.1 predicted ATPase of the AAA superfamily [Clostridium sp. SY8519]
MKFYGREAELKKLKRMYAKDTMSVGLIYGRRRIGKSELIKQSLKECSERSIYFECKKTTEMNNVESLCELLAEIYHFPKPSFRNIEELLEYLFAGAKEEPVILILDEYPYLREVVKGLDSILQSLIDKYRETSKIHFIICGSYVDVMKNLLERENPLYGRIDLTIDLGQMDYYDSALFYSSFSEEDRVRLYSVFGGIPYYNRLIDSELSVKENIIELIAEPGARLENEVAMYLSSEISKITNANEVFETLAKGYSRYSDILSQSHVSSGPTLVDVLDKLIRMEVVTKEAPINDENNKRKAGYFIIDNLSLFYYRYIFRYQSQRNIMDPEMFYERYIARDFAESYVPHIFERVCRQYLIRRNRKGLMEEPFERIGKYYYNDPINHRNGEFDVVTEDSKGYIFYEAKFREAPLSASRIREEIHQVENTGLKCYRYGFISRSGFDAEPDENMIFISIEDLYK